MIYVQSIFVRSPCVDMRKTNAAKFFCVLGIPVVLALSTGKVNGQTCTASDSSQPLGADCNVKQWDFIATYRDENNEGGTYDTGTSSGNDYCTQDHTSCNGTYLQGKTVEATEAFEFESDYGDDGVQFSWTITGKNPEYNYCSNGWYDVTDQDVPVMGGWYRAYCN